MLIWAKNILKISLGKKSCDKVQIVLKYIWQVGLKEYESVTKTNKDV